MAITITKDKNIISMLVEGKAKPYTLDVNTGIVNGLRGNPVKTLPKEVFEALTENRESDLSRLIYTHTSAGAINRLTEIANLLALADSFGNLGISLNMNTWYIENYYRELADDKKLCKAYIKYAKECIKKNQSYSLRDFQNYTELIGVNKRFGFDIFDREYDDIRDRLVNLAEWATDREIKSFTVNFIDTKWYRISESYCRSIMWSQFKYYCDCCRYIEEKVTTKPNFMTEYPRVYKAYQAQKEEIDRKRFKEAMDIHRAEMEFEYGDFKVVIPSTPQEIKDEGKNMHHCVASYAYTCMELNRPNRSHIVFVRHKDTPEKCYITCEIVNGTIYQYYLSHDRHIRNENDIEFKEKYQEHLNRVWKKE